MKKQYVRVGLMVFAAVMLAVGAFAEETYPDQFMVGPDIYHKIFENEKVRASDIAFRPGEAIAMHTHAYDHFVYVLEAGQLTLTQPDGKTAVVDGIVGQLMWIPKESHSAKNTGPTNFRALLVEIKS